MENLETNATEAREPASAKPEETLTEYRSGPNDRDFLKKQVERFTDSPDPVRLRVVEELKAQFMQTVLYGRDVLHLSDTEVADSKKQLADYGFSASDLAGVSTYLMNGLCKICKDHINENQPPKRLNCPRPTNQDAAVRQAVQKEEALVAVTFPDIGTDEVSLELVRRNADGHYVPLTRGELKNPELHILDKTLCSATPDRIKKVMSHVAEKNTIHPLREEILKCMEEYSGTEEEAIKLVDNLPTILMGNDHPIANQGFKQILFTQADLALGNPHAICNLFIPILAGEQGTYKSSTWKTIATLNLPHLEHCYSVCSSTAQQLTQDVTLRSPAAWMELGEVERYLSRSNLDSFKNLVTDTHPMGRRPYDPAPTRFRRMSVWVASTNHSMSVLVDKSSSYDRRLLPIQIPTGSFIDIDQLNSRIREIWGAVGYLYRLGYCTNPASLNPALYADLSEYQEQFRETPPIYQDLMDYAEGMNTIIVSEAASNALGIDPQDVNDELIKEVRAIYKNELPGRGFKQTRKRLKHSRPTVFERDASTRIKKDDLVRKQNKINSDRQRPISFPRDEFDF